MTIQYKCQVRSFLRGEGVLVGEANMDKKEEGLGKGKREGHTTACPGASMD